MLFHLAGTASPDTWEVVDSLFHNVLEDPERFRRPSNLAKGIVNALSAFANAERLADVERVLDELRGLQKARPKDAEVAGSLASGLFNALNYYRNAKRLGDVERVLGELRGLHKARPEETEVAGELAKGLVNALVALGKAERLADVKRVLDELRKLQKARPKDAEVAGGLARGLVGALSHKDGDPESVPKELDQLVEEFEDTEEFIPIIKVLGDMGLGESNGK